MRRPKKVVMSPVALITLLLSFAVAGLLNGIAITANTQGVQLSIGVQISLALGASVSLGVSLYLLLNKLDVI